MPLLSDADIICSPAEDHPGWHDWALRDPSRFNRAIMGRTIIRREEGRSRVRVFPERRHSNLFGGVHGGMILSLVDISMFPTLYLLSSDGDTVAAFNSVSVEVSAQFIGAARMNEPIDSVGEVLHETKRLAFLRGVIEQGDTLVASWSGLVRKPTRT